jgi:hypothetical protein
MPAKTIVFGMNSMFAVEQFLPEILTAVRRRGFHVVVVAPRPDGLVVAFPGVEFCFVPVRRQIAPLADIWALFRLWLLLPGPCSALGCYCAISVPPSST